MNNYSLFEYTLLGDFMKVINLKKKTLFKFSGFLVFIFTISIFSYSFSMQHYYNIDFSTGLVTATNLNVRSGPGTKYPIVTTVKKKRIYKSICWNWRLVCCSSRRRLCRNGK